MLKFERLCILGVLFVFKWLCFPALMQPQPLRRIFTNYIFDRIRVFLGVLDHGFLGVVRRHLDRLADKKREVAVIGFPHAE